MKKSILFDILSIGGIFALTLYVSFTVISDGFNLNFDQNFTIIKIKDYGKVGITINKADGTARTIYKPILEESIDDISYFSFKGKQFLVSNNQEDFDIGLISKVKDGNGILNLYSHNFENKDTSGTYFYNTWKVGDYVTGSNGKQYEIYKMEDYKVKKNVPIDYYRDQTLSFIYFTCLPNTIDYRRVYFFRER